MSDSIPRAQTGDNSVEEFDTKLNRLVRYCPKYVSNEKMKMDCSVASLQIEIKSLVLAQVSSDYAEALRTATLMDSKDRW